ncbi:hypothetical protein HW932_01835 [Allochromatium humboldtianum]|uniref:Uncharacterized protein n=1 Tax=Allochromatium humboldtianum TaxID=504901 RepID=A0A850R0B3_9GAMM|nr:hypothetical protein [Allochromatium humboldtianum]NVZ07999.1 hypothetical protein [Allochromatium humboldtianum]
MNQAPSAKYRCPQCGSTNLRVDCEVTCTLHQTEDGLETEPVKGEEWHWNDTSWMRCADCEYDDEAWEFKLSTQR